LTLFGIFVLEIELAVSEKDVVLDVWFLSSFSSGLDFDSLLSFGLRAELVLSARVPSHFLLYTGFSYRDP